MILNLVNTYVNFFKSFIDYSFLLQPYSYTNQYSFSDPASSLMVGIIDLHHTILFYLIIVSIIVFWLLVYLFCYSSMWSEYSYFNHCPTLEVVWTLIPSMIIASILLPSLSLLHSADELIDPSITVKVIGHQWYWSYEYSDYRSSDLNNDVVFDSYIKSNWVNLIAEPVLILPARTTIRFLITSEDVLHSWAVPAWGVKMDAVPGRLNQVIISLFKPGLYYGQCSEICGIGHGFMPITIEVVPVICFIEWVSCVYAFKKEFLQIPDTISGIIDFVLLNYAIGRSNVDAVNSLYFDLNAPLLKSFSNGLLPISIASFDRMTRQLQFCPGSSSFLKFFHPSYTSNDVFEFILLKNIHNLHKAPTAKDFIYRHLISLLLLNTYIELNSSSVIDSEIESESITEDGNIDSLEILAELDKLIGSTNDGLLYNDPSFLSCRWNWIESCFFSGAYIEPSDSDRCEKLFSDCWITMIRKSHPEFEKVNDSSSVIDSNSISESITEDSNVDSLEILAELDKLIGQTNDDLLYNDPSFLSCRWNWIESCFFSGAYIEPSDSDRCEKLFSDCWITMIRKSHPEFEKVNDSSSVIDSNSISESITEDGNIDSLEILAELDKLIGQTNDDLLYNDPSFLSCRWNWVESCFFSGAYIEPSDSDRCEKLFSDCWITMIRKSHPEFEKVNDSSSVIDSNSISESITEDSNIDSLEILAELDKLIGQTNDGLLYNDPSFLSCRWNWIESCFFSGAYIEPSDSDRCEKLFSDCWITMIRKSHPEFEKVNDSSSVIDSNFISELITVDSNIDSLEILAELDKLIGQTNDDLLYNDPSFLSCRWNWVESCFFSGAYIEPSDSDRCEKLFSDCWITMIRKSHPEFEKVNDSSSVIDSNSISESITEDSNIDSLEILAELDKLIGQTNDGLLYNDPSFLSCRWNWIESCFFSGAYIEPSDSDRCEKLFSDCWITMIRKSHSEFEKVNDSSSVIDSNSISESITEDSNIDSLEILAELDKLIGQTNDGLLYKDPSFLSCRWNWIESCFFSGAYIEPSDSDRCEKLFSDCWITMIRKSHPEFEKVNDSDSITKDDNIDSLAAILSEFKR